MTFPCPFSLLLMKYCIPRRLTFKIIHQPGPPSSSAFHLVSANEVAGDERAVEETNPGRDSPGFLSTRLKIGSGFISLPKSRTPVRQHFPSAMALTELQEPLAYSGPVVVAALFHPPKFCLFIKGFLFFFFNYPI